jgi:hypothetical protein
MREAEVQGKDETKETGRGREGVREGEGGLGFNRRDSRGCI